MDVPDTFPAPKLDVLCSGSPLEHGLAIGSTLHSRIARAETCITNFETFRAHQPWWLPFSLYRRWAERQARYKLEPNVSAAFPAMADRIRGIAEGANTSVDFLYLFHAMESVSAPSDTIAEPALAGCTAIAATRSRTPNGQAILAHNFDLVELAGPLLSARETQGERFRYMGFTLAPMAGIVDGINEAGLSITYDYAPTTDVDMSRPPVSFTVEDALATCATVAEAATRLRRLPRGGGAMLMLADATGDVASLELSANHSHLRRPGENDVVQHSNAYQSSEMQAYELPRNAIYTENAPPALRNLRIFESAERRDARMADLMDEVGTIHETTLTEIMSDHGPDNEPSANTVCMHGGYWSTLSSVQMIPNERRMRLSYGPACQGDYVDFQL